MLFRSRQCSVGVVPIDLKTQACKKKAPYTSSIRCFLKKFSTYFFGAIAEERFCKIWLRAEMTLPTRSVAVLPRGSASCTALLIPLFKSSTCCWASFPRVSRRLLMAPDTSLLVPFDIAFIVFRVIRKQVFQNIVLPFYVLSDNLRHFKLQSKCKTIRKGYRKAGSSAVLLTGQFLLSKELTMLMQ